MTEKDDQEKKIIVDEDWKEQARKEKEELAEAEEAKTKAEEQQEHRPLPEADFSGLVSMLATQALYALKFLSTEEDKDRPIDLDLAKFNIDMLTVIEEKTKGNLTEDEEKALTEILSQARMAFVQASEKTS